MPENFNELISVIVPVYNVEPYIRKCIDSILAQTYNNLEILLVDDGSTDRSCEICDEYAASDSRIRVTHQANGGLSAARNAGLKMARGNLIGFVDSDDYIDKTMYEKLYRIMKEHEADISICAIEAVDEQGNILGLWDSFSFKEDAVLTGKQALQMLDTERGDYNWHFVTACNKLLVKRLFDGNEFEVGRIHEDEIIVARLFFNCAKIAVTSDKLYFGLIRSSSISNSSPAVKRLDTVYAYYIRYNFLMSINERTLALSSLRNAAIKLTAILKESDSLPFRCEAHSLTAKVAFGMLSHGNIKVRRLLKYYLRFLLRKVSGSSRIK